MAVIHNPLDFEREVVELENELTRTKERFIAGETSLADSVSKLEKRLSKLKLDVYGNLTPYQRVQLSRHFDRPFTQDFINHMTVDFIELHGDRCFKDDPAIIAGIGRLGDYRVAIVGQQRGRNMKERLARNFGMANPDGYRKARRVFELAENFGLPLICLIDTQGAFPGLEAEERGQAQAIAVNLEVLAALKTPTISVVIGEGGSGGALALGVTDRILMLENGCYSVITPEGCASILWHQASGEPPQKQAALSAELLKLTAADLFERKVIDEVVREPEGGAHRNHEEAAENLKQTCLRHLAQLTKLSKKELIEARYKKFRGMGPFEEGK